MFFKCVPFCTRLPSGRRSVRGSNEAITCTLHTARSPYQCISYVIISASVLKAETTAAYTLFCRVQHVPVRTAYTALPYLRVRSRRPSKHHGRPRQLLFKRPSGPSHTAVCCSFSRTRKIILIYVYTTYVTGNAYSLGVTCNRFIERPKRPETLYNTHFS